MLRRVLFPEESASQPAQKRRKVDASDATVTDVGAGDHVDSAEGVQNREVVLETADESFLLSCVHDEQAPRYDISLILRPESSEGKLDAGMDENAGGDRPAVAGTKVAAADLDASPPSSRPQPDSAPADNDGPTLEENPPREHSSESPALETMSIEAGAKPVVKDDTLDNGGPLVGDTSKPVGSTVLSPETTGPAPASVAFGGDSMDVDPPREYLVSLSYLLRAANEMGLI